MKGQTVSSPDSVLRIDVRMQFMRTLAAMMADKAIERKWPTVESPIRIGDALQCALELLDAQTDLIQRYMDADLERAIRSVNLGQTRTPPGLTRK